GRAHGVHEFVGMRELLAGPLAAGTAPVEVVTCAIDHRNETVVAAVVHTTGRGRVTADGVARAYRLFRRHGFIRVPLHHEERRHRTRTLLRDDFAQAVFDDDIGIR